MKTYEKHYDNYYFDTFNWIYVSIDELKKDFEEIYRDEYTETFDDFMVNALSKNGGLETVEYAYRWAKDDMDCFLGSLEEYDLTLETLDKFWLDEYNGLKDNLEEAEKYLKLK